MDATLVKDILDVQKQPEKRFYVLTENQLQDFHTKTAEVAAAAAVKAFRDEIKSNRKRISDRRLHNTELLLRNYHILQLNVENTVLTIREMKKEQSANEILSLMMDDDKDEILLESVKRSKVKTIMLLKHIDRMLEIYRIYCEQSLEDYDKRRYNVLYDRYIADPALDIMSIADKYFISKDTVYSDLRIAKERISALFFGIDGFTV